MLVLFVDDDSEDCDLFFDAVSEIDPDIKCLRAIDGEDAIRLLTEHLFVLPSYVFMDVNMPGMGGKQCLIQIKRHSALKDIPVIIFSTTIDRNEINDLKKIGAMDCIIKPSQFKDLVRSVRSIIKQEV